MSATIVHTRFTDLRTLSARFFAFYARETGATQSELSSSYIVDVDGVDAADLLEKFSAQFQVRFDTFKFEDHFYNEGEWSMALGSFLPILLLPLLLTLLVIRIVSGSAADTLLSHLQKIGSALDGLGIRLMRPVKPLTLGDLIVSATIGHFAMRSQTRLICQI